MDGNKLEAGNLVVDGIYWNKVPRAKDWYTPPWHQQVFTFRVRYCLKGDVYLVDPTIPCPFPRIRYRYHALSLNPKKISDESREQLNQALNQRKLIDFYEGNLHEETEEEGDEEQEDDEQYDDSNSNSSDESNSDENDDGENKQPL